MAVLSPTILEAEEIGSPVSHIRVLWNDPDYGTANAATGFKLKHDDQTGTLPAWTSAIDAALAGGGDGNGNYEVILPATLAGGVAVWHEDFEAYPLGTIIGSQMTEGGIWWNGAWVSGGLETSLSSEGFESYSLGVAASGTLNGGSGWTTAWISGV